MRTAIGPNGDTRTVWTEAVRAPFAATTIRYRRVVDGVAGPVEVAAELLNVRSMQADVDADDVVWVSLNARFSKFSNGTTSRS